MKNKTTVTLAVFIISWAGKHENAISISNEALAATSDVNIVYSDPDPRFIPNASCKLIQRSNELFWEDKFKACLDACGEKPILIIHADCTCDDWRLLIESYIDAVEICGEIGVWAPKIEGTPFALNYSKLFRIESTGLYISALTDAIVFALSPQIISRMRSVKFGANPFGWGTAGLFCAASHVMNKLVVIDDSINVFHPCDTGYDKKVAADGLRGFLTQFTIRERVEYLLLNAYVEFNRSKYT